MSPLLLGYINNASSIQRQNLDPTRRILAYLLTAYGGSALGQQNALASADTRTPAVANSVAAKFQGFTEENYLDVLTWQLAVRLNVNGVAGLVSAGTVPTDGFALNGFVNNAWGGPNGIVDAQQVDALIKYGMLLQFGANLTAI